MPKAEVGSTKYIANKMKAKGLQRLRWYCQICEKQCRDENGFKQHTLSEGHVRAMLRVGEDPRKYIDDYSRQFRRDFLRLLKTAHGEKKVPLNHFYQEYIRDKEHVHMNATKWPSLTEFAKFLGKEGLCRVEEGERGLEIAFVDDSPEAIRRREDVRRKEKQAKGDEDMEARMLEQQIKRAREAAVASASGAEDRRQQQQQQQPDPLPDVPAVPVKLSLSLEPKAAKPPSLSSDLQAPTAAVQIDTFSSAEPSGDPPAPMETAAEDDVTAETPAMPKMSLALAGPTKPANPLMKKRNPLAKKKENVYAEPDRKMSNAERIMREELMRKRGGDGRGYDGGKRQRLG